ncbi:ABC transporter ATP-binding protein [Paenibacillus alkalitolerans]|uniref:ABC transporter ATP-binding protein n=1 Tax=Paenibacillus alkalitolerans TaxID=2799335 RepID=UPI0018F45BE5|nr:ABC transporter ATP-binding protein [Paenibacillus alkalitolerans]
MSASPVLDIRNVSIAAIDSKGVATKMIVRGLDLTLHAGEMLALVGESGSGKSVSASAVLGLLPKELKITEGSISFNGVPVSSMAEKERRALRGKRIGYIFQNYQGSFTPFMTVGKQMVEVIRAHERLSMKQAKETALAWLHKVKLPADRAFRSYPFQLSGGQLQRASLAAALMLKPSLIIADEPTTALDVLTGEQVLDLLSELRKEAGCAVLLISHDLAHVFKRTDRMAVMYGGSVIESGSTEKISRDPQHPYTQLLLQARPPLSGPLTERLEVIPGEPGLVCLQGCPFSLRCPYASEHCSHTPAMANLNDDHAVACHERPAKGEPHVEYASSGEPVKQVVYS